MQIYTEDKMAEVKSKGKLQNGFSVKKYLAGKNLSGIYTSSCRQIHDDFTSLYCAMISPHHDDGNDKDVAHTVLLS